MWCFGKLTSGCKKMEAFRLILSFKLLWSSSLGSRAVVGVQIIWIYYSHKIWTSTTVAITSCVCVISNVPWSKLVLLTSSNKGLANEWLVSGEIVWNRIRGIISQGGLSLPNTMILFLTFFDHSWHGGQSMLLPGEKTGQGMQHCEPTDTHTLLRILCWPSELLVWGDWGDITYILFHLEVLLRPNFTRPQSICHRVAHAPRVAWHPTSSDQTWAQKIERSMVGDKRVALWDIATLESNVYTVRIELHKTR